MCHIFVDNLILTSIICSLLGDKAFIKTQPQNTTPPTAAVLKATFCSLAAAILSIIHPPDYPGNTQIYILFLNVLKKCTGGGRFYILPVHSTIEASVIEAPKRQHKAPFKRFQDNKEMALSKTEIDSSIHEPDSSTSDFIMQQTMLRVKDPKVSLDFYTRVLGMR